MKKIVSLLLASCAVLTVVWVPACTPGPCYSKCDASGQIGDELLACYSK